MKKTTKKTENLKKFFKFGAAVTLATAALQACGPSDVKMTAEERKLEMSWVYSQFEGNYAPLKYKQDRFGFNWEQRKAEYLAKVEQDMSNEEFRMLVFRLVNGFKDAHTSAMQMFDGLPNKVNVAYLGFFTQHLVVDGQHRAVIAGRLPTIDQNPSGYPLNVGDHIVGVNGGDIDTFIKKYCARDLGQDESTRTATYGNLGFLYSLECEMPKDDFVTLNAERYGKAFTVKLPWIRKDFRTLIQEQWEVKMQASKTDAGTETINQAIAKEWNLDKYLEYIKKETSYGSPMKRRHNYLVAFPSAKLMMSPILGTDARRPGTSDGSIKVENGTFDVRAYTSDKGLIGYIKIESFMPDDEYTSIYDFAKARKSLNDLGVKSLVLDLVDNGGGSLEYGLALAAQFKDENGSEPALTARLNNNWVDSFHFQAMYAPNDYLRELGNRKLKDFRASLDKGDVLSAPFKLSETMAALKVPGEKNTLPVVIMTNEMCASMCDIFTADMRDNNVAKVFGKKTMGAGGNVQMHAFSPRTNLLLSQTESLIIRANGEYVENMGIEPDVAYEPTEADMLTGNAMFRKAAAKYASTLVAPAPTDAL